jgi:hypothetical protein
MGSPEGVVAAAMYSGTFGSARWDSMQQPIRFSSVPTTSCCGFGLIEPQNQPYFCMDEEMVTEFLRQAHFSGFLVEQNRRSKTTDLDSEHIANVISNKYEGIFKLHWYEIEPAKPGSDKSLQMFLMEIKDCNKFEAWKAK